MVSPQSVAFVPDDAAPPTMAPRHQAPLGQLLLEDGAVDPGNLLKASVMRGRQSSRLGQILLSQGWVTPEALLRALCRQWRTTALDPAKTPGDPRLIDALGTEFCLANAILPWRRIGGVTWIATARPEAFADLIPGLPESFGQVRMLLCSEDQVQAAILASRRIAMIRRAELRVPATESCRSRNESRTGRIALGAMAALALGLWLVPVAVLSALTLWATLSLVAQSGLKLLALLSTRRVHAEERALAENLAQGCIAREEMTGPLPVISVMVPLFRESDVAGKLVGRLSRLDYPRELTDILLVIEDSDHVTRKALQGARLPGWIRVVEVPNGPIQTKPRALNYALNFCRGEIIGVWDAEDRPEPDQLHKVARHLHVAPPEVACVQGALDFYNPCTNWLARCFTLEYSAWFRGVLPGLARMGLVVPLGGTTFFIRRPALAQAGGWDGWNVTEDADLGVRLARLGYRTEIVATTTHEEANCRALPWIKQRSRWLKGFAMTWGVHMRAPSRLVREIGFWPTVGFHLQMFATVQQFMLAPVLWSFWLLTIGLGHPLGPLVDGWLGTAVIATFLLSEALNVVVAIWAVRRTHPHLMPWAPTLYFYFPLACLAAWKAAYEIVAKPFYWDKTTHGVFDHAADETPEALPEGALIPVLNSLSRESCEAPAETMPLRVNGSIG